MSEEENLPPETEVRDSQFYREHPDQLTVEFTLEPPSFLNNFYMNFPAPPEYDAYYYRRCCEAIGVMKKKFREWAADEIAGHSEIYINQTGEEFFAALDRVVYEIAPDYDELYRKAVEEIGREYERYTVPKGLRPLYVEVYKKMRSLGYTHKELVA
jgi:hypothetical protein